MAWLPVRLGIGERLDLPPVDNRPSPCESCQNQSCMQTCPVAAFGEGGYDVPVCAQHLATPEGRYCMELGCRARRACPVGAAARYEPEQAAFHMQTFFKAHGGKTGS
ncbi:MAG: hypothetical protein HOH04_00880 [Rhodospirillaceae bacterium]|nr:hypothetical protein [Rhodospirillaceae bacterium]